MENNITVPIGAKLIKVDELGAHYEFPNIFHELLLESKKRYTIGTKFIDNYGNIRSISSIQHYGRTDNDNHVICAGSTPESEWDNKDSESNPYIYCSDEGIIFFKRG